MFRRVDLSSFPTIHNFSQAEEYMRDTKPMQSGANMGMVPLRSQRDADNYLLRHCPEAVHPVTGVLTTYYAAVQMGTEIVRWFEDDTIAIHAYHSNTTKSAQSALLHGMVSVTSAAGHKCVTIPIETIDPHMDTTLLAECLFLPDDVRGDPYMRSIWIWFDPEADYMILQHIGGDRYRPLSYGVGFGPGRKYHNGLHGKFIRAIQKTCRAMAAFNANDPALSKSIEGSLPPTHNLVQYIDHVIMRTGWAPGKPITGEILKQMLDHNVYAENWKERMSWTQGLRMTPKPINYVSQPRNGYSYIGLNQYTIHKVVTLAKAHAMCEEIEAAIGQPLL